MSFGVSGRSLFSMVALEVQGAVWSKVTRFSRWRLAVVRFGRRGWRRGHRYLFETFGKG